LSTIRKFAGQTAVYGISTILSRVLNFFLTPLYTTVYPPKLYGIFTYMYSWASMLNAILSFGMETTFFRYLNKHEDNKDKVYCNTFLTIAAISVIFLSFTGLFFDNIVNWMQNGKTGPGNDYAQFVKYFIYILVTDALAVIPFAKIRAEGKALRYAIIKFTNIGAFIGLNLFFIYSYPEKWVGYVFISNLLASLLTLILLLPELLQLKFRFDKRLLQEMMLYSFPVLIANISFTINENIDKIFLNLFLPPSISETEVGIYGACCKIAIFLSIFINAFRLGAEPFFFSHVKSSNSGITYARIMNYFVIAVCVIFVALVANIEILKYFIGGDPVKRMLYWSGLDVVPVLLFGYVSLGIYMNLSIWYKLSDQTRYGLYISGIGATITIVLNIIFIPKYSYMAAAWVSLIAYASMMILSYLMGQKNYPIPYNLKRNLLYLVSSVIIVILSFIVFNRSLIIGNLLLLLFVTAVFFAERKELKAAFTK
jgi:O-antigen/teichoic acid export membrane protein